MGRGLNHPPQSLQVDSVHILAILSLGSLQKLGYVLKAGIVHDQLKRLQPQLSLADMMVAINAASKPPKAVIDMDDLQVFQPYNAIKPGEGLLISCAGTQVIPCREGVASIEADPGGAIDMRTEPRELFESISDSRSLACGGLQKNGGAFCHLGENLIQALCYEVQTLLLTRIPVRARVHDEVGETQFQAALHFIAQGRSRPEAQWPNGGCQVNQVGIVAHHRRYISLISGLMKEAHFFLFKGRSFPLVGILGEDLNGGAPELYTA
jgi:hypothetical protein